MYKMPYLIFSWEIAQRSQKRHIFFATRCREKKKIFKFSYPKSVENIVLNVFIFFQTYSSSEGLDGVAPITEKNFSGGNPNRVSKSHVNLYT